MTKTSDAKELEAIDSIIDPIIKDEPWHRKIEEKEKLINLINFHGFVLEDRVKEAISSVYRGVTVKSGAVYIRPGEKEVERVEIDAWLRNAHHYFIFEVKSSIYDWIFLRGPNTSQHFHLMLDDQQGFCTRANPPNRQHPFNMNVTEVGFEILSNRLQGGTSLEIAGTSNKTLKALNLPERPSNREIIRPATKQLFKNLETLVYHEMFEVSQSNPRTTFGCMFLPFLVTNAPLYVASYYHENVNENGVLVSLESLEEVPWLAYNYQEILHWDHGLRQQVKHIGWYKDDCMNRINYKGSHLKSIFVVQYQHLGRFLREMG